ncbi:MAG: response regulator [Desulfitobacteriaceae bacterium]
MNSVLIVDDSGFLRVMLKQMLTENGYEVIGEAVNGRDAIDKYQKLTPKLVTMDITMPEMSGIEAVVEIMKIDKHAKIIMVTAIGQLAAVLASIKAGAKDFILKPYEEEKVIAVLGRICQEIS